MIWRRIWVKKKNNSWISSSSRYNYYACNASYYTTKPTPPTPTSTSVNKNKNQILGFPFSATSSSSSSSSSLIRSRYESATPTLFAMHIDVKSLYATQKCYFSSQAVLDPPVGGIIEIPLAQTGEGIAECELIQWFVNEGDHVEEFQPLCEVQSDKATIEITSRYKGQVSEILFGPGDIVKVGETILKLVSEQSQTSTLISDGLKDTFSLASNTCDSSTEELSLEKHKIEGVLSTPVVRHLAKEYGININDIHGTGKEGRVLKEDVLKYAADRGLCEISEPSHARSMEHLPIKEEKYSHTLHFEDKTMPLRGFQRSMVKSMTMAAKVPHFHYLEEINCDALVELKAAFQNENSDPDVKHTYLPFLIKSLSKALSKYPLINSSFNEEAHQIILKGSHNIGVAMATPYGLVVPNIKKVQSLSILEITKELSRLQQLAVNNKLSTEDISGGTITLSNIGAIGGKFGSPIINLPEVAIIAIGRIQKLPRFADDGSVYPASLINVNIGADHRIVDGATVARFCNEWKLLIEKPELLMLHMR